MHKYRLKGTAGPAINQTFKLVDSLRIGSADDCDIRLEADAGSALANQGLWAVVEIDEENRIRIRSHGGPESISVNGEAVNEGPLALGDELRIGKSRFILQAPGLRPERVLTDEVAQAKGSVWPWLISAAVIAGGAVLAWQQGWLTGLGL